MQDWLQYQAPAQLLQDRVILVTGAGQGLGEVAAKALAAHGATVILLGRNEKKLAKVYDAIEAAGWPQPAAIPFDLGKASDQDCQNLANLIWKEFGRLDGVLHNANGFTHLSPAVNQKLEEWVEMFRVNVAAPFALTRSLLPLLKAAPDAAVLFTGETHGIDVKAYWGGYAVSKSAQRPLTAILASEWDSLSQLRLNWLIPGPVRSPLRTQTHPGEAKDSLPEADSLAPVYLYWLGPASAGQSGQVVDVAAGQVYPA